MRIGIDGRFLQDKFHGIGRYTAGLIGGLSTIPGDHEITLFVDPGLPVTRLPLEELTALPRVRAIPVAIPMYHPRELWAWNQQMRRSPVDVFHSPYFWAPLGLRCALVTTVHDMIFDRYPEYMPGRRFRAPYWAMSRLALARSQAVIAVSDATRDDILAFTRTRHDKVSTVLSGVTSGFHPQVSAAEIARVRAAHDLPDHYVLALGARRPHKNIHGLIGAFARIASTVPHALVLAGDIDDRFPDGSVGRATQLRQDGRIRELGHVDEADLPGLYAGADLFVQPSVIEGFGLPVLEAMRTGTAVACSRTSSLPEVAGDAAEYFDPLSEIGMATALNAVLQAPERRAAMAHRGLERAERFTWAAAAQGTLEVYRRAVAGRERVVRRITGPSSLRRRGGVGT